MKHIWQILQSLAVIAVLLLLIATIHVPGQTIELDENVRREMTAYAKRAAESLEVTRPRLVQTSVLNAETVQRQQVQFSKISNKEIAGYNKLSALEMLAFNILNQKRAANGLEPLKWNEDIARVARLHSVNMARYKFFSHQGIDGQMVNDRADSLGVSHWHSIGENIAFNKGFKLPAESACEQWMQSSSHRENLLDKRWKETGIGVALAQDGTYYFTQVFILK